MRRIFSRLALLLLTASISQLPLLAQGVDPRPKEIDEYAARALQDWGVPGLAIAVVKDGRVVLAKGFGVRELGKPVPVDENTLFAIASNTKAFTAAALGILVDEGKIQWDAPVTKYLPGFQMYDPYVTREMTVRDLLSHRSGLATFAGDLLWYDSTYSRDELLQRVRYLKPASSFRTRYGYQNLMFLAAGQIIPAVTGKSWDEFVRERFFVPLGMTATNTSVSAFKPGDNIAMPHNEKGGKLRVIPYDQVDNIGSGGSINSNVKDMANWIRLQLGRGTYEGKRIFSPEVSRAMWSPHIFLSISEQAERTNPTQHFSAYGLGWSLNDYQGRKIVSHSGGLGGMISRVVLVPEENLGVVVLTNSETSLSRALANKVVDLYLNAPARDWSAEMLASARAGRAAAAQAEKKLESERATGTNPSLALSKYAGTYTDRMYGDARISEENGKLVLKFIPSPNFVADLEHWQYDTFRVKWRDSVRYPFGLGFVTFNLNARGQVEQMKIDVPNPDFDFTEFEFKRTQAAGAAK